MYMSKVLSIGYRYPGCVFFSSLILECHLSKIQVSGLHVRVLHERVLSISELHIKVLHKQSATM